MKSNMNQMMRIIRHGPSAVMATLKGSSRKGRSCPYCAAVPVLFAKRGRLSKVLECPRCALLYGWPKQDTGFNDKFYQQDYSKAHQCFTTEMPEPAQLEEIAAGRFTSVGKNIDWVVDLLSRIAPQGRLLDYGCSWGYALRQFSDAGYDVTGLEVCRHRAEYGRRHLKLPIHDDTESLIAGGTRFDLIYTSHVLEHLPDPGIALRLFERVAAPGCVLLIRVPNCGGAEAIKQGVRWGPFSSVIHPLSYRAAFFERNFPKHGFEVKMTASEPYDTESYAKSFRDGTGHPSDGDDLVMVAVRNPSQ